MRDGFSEFVLDAEGPHGEANRVRVSLSEVVDVPAMRASPALAWRTGCQHG